MRKLSPLVDREGTNGRVQNRINTVSGIYNDCLQNYDFPMLPALVIKDDNEDISAYNPRARDIELRGIPRIEIYDRAYEDGTFSLAFTLQHEFGHAKDHVMRGVGFGKNPRTEIERRTVEDLSNAIEQDKQRITDLLDNNEMRIFDIPLHKDDLTSTLVNAMILKESIASKIEDSIRDDINNQPENYYRDLIPGLYTRTRGGGEMIDDLTISKIANDFSSTFIDILQSIVDPEIGHGLTHSIEYANDNPYGEEGVANIIALMSFDSLTSAREIMKSFPMIKSKIESSLRRIRHERA